MQDIMNSQLLTQFRPSLFHQAQLEFLAKENPTVIELFAGAGGLALGFEEAGFNHVLLNEINKDCCNTLLKNRPDWPIKKEDVAKINFIEYQHKVDVVAGGFPCQAFSVAGKLQGFNDKRGLLFFEYARAVREVKPKLFIAENVKGLLFHDKGNTIKIILETLRDCGYKILQPQLLRAIHYQVPQDRERIFIVGVRNDIAANFHYPIPDAKIYTLTDALKAGEFYRSDVPISNGTKYSEAKFNIMRHVPEGGNWKNLPIEFQKSYLNKLYDSKYSKSQAAKRLNWNKPCNTLLTSPDSKLIGRCHPTETRPLTIREYARIQTFPDDWQFTGSISSQYRQIGNAVPVNLAKAIATSALKFVQQHNQSISI